MAERVFMKNIMKNTQEETSATQATQTTQLASKRSGLTPITEHLPELLRRKVDDEPLDLHRDLVLGVDLSDLPKKRWVRISTDFGTILIASGKDALTTRVLCRVNSGTQFTGSEIDLFLHAFHVAGIQLQMDVSIADYARQEIWLVFTTRETAGPRILDHVYSRLQELRTRAERVLSRISSRPFIEGLAVPRGNIVI
jgi:hypothetical protein